jgi:hypothetical protein
MRDDKELHKAVLAVMLGQKLPVEEAKKPLHPNQQEIDVHEPEKDEITAKDFEHLRAGKKAKMKEEVDQIDELSKETMSSYLQKRGSMVSPRSKNNKGNENMVRAVNKIAKKANEEVELDEVKKPMSQKEKDKVVGAVTTAMRQSYANVMQGRNERAAARMNAKIKSGMKEEIEIGDDADETILIHTPIDFELAENYMFGDYLTAAKSIVGDEKAIELANYAFNKNDTTIFVEQFMRSDIEDKVKTHQKAGHKVSMPKYSTKSGKPYAEYVVTDKESGVRRKYIHHGNARSIENMGAAGKRDE